MSPPQKEPYFETGAGWWAKWRRLSSETARARRRKVCHDLL